jgi:5-methyltetrahydrofolate--homocysteine methyltransferase
MQRAGLTIPLMIGGATTSKQHTALKIAPHYDYPVVHVMDASLSPSVAFRLLNKELRAVFVEELNREYAALRAAHASAPSVLAGLEYARRHPHRQEWGDYVPVAPPRAGVRLLSPIPVATVIPYINWTYFYHAWKVQKSSEEASRLRTDADDILRRLSEGKTACCRAIYAVLPANSEGDTIRMGERDFPVLRQQESAEGVYKSLADYVLPASLGRPDYMGLFAVTADVGDFAAEGDSYRSMLLQTLADRLTEAASEYLHQQIRRSLWGYAPDESLSIAELHKGKYRGIRPAVGFPSLPDQRQNFILDGILDFSRIGVRLTENGAMLPVSSASGLYIAHPGADYFVINAIDRDQLADYARRRNVPEAEMHKLLMRICAF